MKLQYILILFTFISCVQNTKVKKEPITVIAQDTVKPVEDLPKIDDKLRFNQLLKELRTKTVPLIDSTNFDTFIEERKIYNKEEISILQLEKIYPNYYKEGYNYRATPNYKIKLSNKFHSVVIAIYKGDHEMESVLINYDFNRNTISSKVISYDEIAESLSRKHSKIENNIITIIDEFYGDTKQIDTTKFHISRNGELNQIKTKYSSNLKNNKTILLNQTYTDTIVFSRYDDNGDYFMLLGKKNENDISLIYDWEWTANEKYNFKYGDSIKVKWEMSSISIAGDEEIVAFREKAIDAEKILSKNKQVKFLWRADKFDKELNQEINSIFINKSFCSSISNQEKAALSYVATFIGNECSWDGEVNENRSNLKCKILTALDLGYQCSDKHLGFLQSWFSKDATALKKLEKCGTMPYTATIQTTFDEITVFTDKDNKTIKVNFKAYRINVRESSRESWTQTNIFKYDLENITLISSKKSDLKEK